MKRSLFHGLLRSVSGEAVPIRVGRRRFVCRSAIIEFPLSDFEASVRDSSHANFTQKGQCGATLSERSEAAARILNLSRNRRRLSNSESPDLFGVRSFGQNRLPVPLEPPSADGVFHSSWLPASG